MISPWGGKELLRVLCILCVCVGSAKWDWVLCCCCGFGVFRVFFLFSFFYTPPFIEVDKLHTYQQDVGAVEWPESVA